MKMKLEENEARALEELRTLLFQRFPFIGLRLYGSKARGEGGPFAVAISNMPYRKHLY